MRTKFILLAIVIVLLGVFIPKIAIQDHRDLTADEISCAKRDTYMLLDNPIERGLVIKLAVNNKEGNVLHVSAYTFGGLKYATIELICGEQATVTWRRWFKDR